MDRLQIYFGKDLVINDRLCVKQPTIRDVVNAGEEEYYDMVFALTAISSDMKSFFWDQGIDWADVSDFEMFYMFAPIVDKEKSKILFGDLDLSGFKMCQREDGEMFMVNKDDVVIDKYVHKQIFDFLCGVHSIKKQPEFAANKRTKMVLIEDDRMRHKRKNKEHESQLLPLISAMVNCADFKYDLDTVQDMKLYAFMDSVRRIQHSRSVSFLTTAYYSGNLDTDKFDTRKLEWICDLDKAK